MRRTYCWSGLRYLSSRAKKNNVALRLIRYWTIIILNNIEWRGTVICWMLYSSLEVERFRYETGVRSRPSYTVSSAMSVNLWYYCLRELCSKLYRKKTPTWTEMDGLHSIAVHFRSMSDHWFRLRNCFWNFVSAGRKCIIRPADMLDLLFWTALWFD